LNYDDEYYIDPLQIVALFSFILILGSLYAENSLTLRNGLLATGIWFIVALILLGAQKSREPRIIKRKED
jgi:hypothetical protein